MITCKVDTSGLNRGIQAAEQYSKRTTPELVNTAAYWVAVNAKSTLPFVTPEKVDSELSVITNPVIGKRGKPLKSKKRYSAAPQAGGGAPLAALIVQARARPNSRYNLLTSGRYALPSSPFKGVSREAGRAAMAALVDKLIKARHKSGKFLIAGWIPVVIEMGKHAVQKFMRGGPSPSEGKRAYYGAELGQATPARDGLSCAAVIENDVGMEGKNRASHNRALMTYGMPALQGAIDREGKQQMEYAMRKMEAELADKVKPHWG